MDSGSTPNFVNNQPSVDPQKTCPTWAGGLHGVRRQWCSESICLSNFRSRDSLVSSGWFCKSGVTRPHAYDSISANHLVCSAKHFGFRGVVNFIAEYLFHGGIATAIASERIRTGGYCVGSFGQARSSLSAGFSR